MSLRSGEVDQFYVCPGVGRSGGEVEALNRGVGAWKTRAETCLGGRLSRSVSPGESGPVKLSVVSAATMSWAFPRPLVGSSR